MVLAGDLTGGWGSLRVLDTTQIKLEPEATEEQPDVFGKWHTVITEAEVIVPTGHALGLSQLFALGATSVWAWGAQGGFHWPRAVSNRDNLTGVASPEKSCH